MPTYVLKAPNGDTFEATGDHYPSATEQAQIFKDMGVDAPPTTQKPSDSASLGIATASAALPATARGMASFAASPTAAKTTGAVARALTTAGAVGHGLYTGSMPEVLAAPLEGWGAGKGGYFLGKAAQSIAGGPVGRAVSKLATEGSQASVYARPYASTVGSVLSAAQGGLDIAQMDDPKRTDIGFMGVGLNEPRSAEDQAAHPAAVNALAEQAATAIRELVNKGMSVGDAMRAYFNSLLAAKNR